MAKLRHITISVPDPEKSAQFYEAVFGMKRAGLSNTPISSGVYLSDGVVNLTILKFRTDEAAGIEGGKEYVGLHHLGFQVDDVEDAKRKLQEHGAKFFMHVPPKGGTARFEDKFYDPDGIMLDVSSQGWIGTE